MNIINVEQGSPEWFHSRLGKITASNFDKVITSTLKQSSQVESLINIAVSELLLGEPIDTFTSDAMARGKDLEDEALSTVNFITGLDFKKVGFIDSGRGYGCSPDGLCDGYGLELKCPLIQNHVEYLAGGELPKKYLAQVQGSMAVTGFKEWYFCSYHPGVKPLIVRVDRDDEYCSKLIEYLEEASCEILRRYEALKSDFMVAA